MTAFLAEGPPISHPTIDICGSNGHNLLCVVSWDSLASSAIAIVATLVIVMLIAYRVSHGVPGRLQLALELIYGYVRGQVVHIDEEATFVIPLALTIFFYILIANWIDFFPIPAPLHPANSDLNQTAAMAVVVIIVVQWYSIKVLGFRGYLRRFTRPFELPWFARVPFTLLNIIEEIAKPLTLALRLFGNIFGGLLMLYVLTVLLPQIPIPYAPTILSAVVTAGWKAFDVLFIGAIQAFIFMLLTIIYFEMAREGLEPEGGHAPATASAAHSAH
ncbi:MAG: F0F1 ATP synthase subunit A [Candidatus Dormibacteraceae bacterium]